MSEQAALSQKEYYLLKGFPSMDLIAAFNSRHLKNMSLFYGDTRDAANNRKAFLSTLGINYLDLVCAKQVHGSKIKHVQEEDRGKGALACDTALADTDALITDKRNLPLAIFTADCLPIFLYDPITPAIGLIHAGWRSTQEDIAVKVMALMQENFNTHPKNLLVSFGPAIRECCYGVGEEFRKLFPGYLAQRGGHYYLDLVGINKDKILDLGVKEANIFDAKLCTSCKNTDFFSFRREGNSCGRMMSVIMLS